MNIYLASDHAGFELKNTLIAYLRDEKGMLGVVDCGASEYDEGDDYTKWIPRAISPLLKDLEGNNKDAAAIILGGSGEGEAMAANRFKHIRATAYYGGDTKILELSRQHNNANVLSLGARFLSVDEAKEAVDLWLSTSFSGEERHVRRNEALDTLTNN
jgi:ribose 5-phosphate isomerase B